MHSVRTKLSVIDQKLLRLFFDANDMEEVIIGSYDEIVTSWQTNHLICYAYSDTFEKATASMTYITMKYGSVEKAYLHFKDKISKGYTPGYTISSQE